MGIFDGMGPGVNPPHGHPDHRCEDEVIGVFVQFAMMPGEDVEIRALITTPGFSQGARQHLLTMVAAAIASERYQLGIPVGPYVIKAVS